ncbi:MAG: YigZ family protein [Lentisphaeria bacterium]|nr:YigZ family protein [Lentisphaeria bacterium]
MLIIQKSGQAEIRVKNSRFLAEVFPVHTPEEAKAAWKYRKENYDNGGHIVYAFTVGKQQNISGCSDDGEPAGTAGKPVLAVLLGSKVTNAMITVARWFGGTKLGTGGLVHAYSDAAKAAVENCVFADLVPMDELRFTIPYPLYAQVKAFLNTLDFTVSEENFAGDVTISGRIKQADSPKLSDFLREISNGRITLDQE